MIRGARCWRLALSLVISMAVSFAVLHAPAAAARKIKKTPPQAAPVSPGSWHARIVGSEASPSRLVAVDKTQQTLFLFERHSPLRIAGQYACTTGQAGGDKLVEGDLKTPEGVYFVNQRLASGLNYEKYGYEAYTLNYPNPVDRLRRKTGYGIWIHGRGVPIMPNLTEGCVSLNNTDIAVLGKNLTPGTPVALAEQVDFAPVPSPEELATLGTLYKQTQEWAKAWSAKSRKFFDYYDQDAYSAAQGESFSAFRRQKERVFKAVSRIDVTVRNVQALQGPGYWVTWFEQEYRASNLSAKGVRRLYWWKDKKGEMRIVGMEWEPRLSGTLTAGLNGAPVASGPPPGPEKTPGTATASASETRPGEDSSPQAELPMPVAQAVPALEPDRAPTLEPVPLAPSKTLVAMAPVEAAPGPGPIRMAPGMESKSEPGSGVTAVPESRQPKLEDVAGFVEAWRRSWERGDLAAYAGCYAEKAVQGSRAGVAAIRSHKEGLWGKSRPRSVVLTNIRITTKQDMIVVDMRQAYTDSRSFADMGIKTLYLQPEGDAWRIVREDWSPMY